jgi:hypothetical protein
MASFDLKDADVAAVFLRRRTGPNTFVLRRAAYNFITYPDGSSGLEPVPVQNPSNGGVETFVTDFEVDRIEVYDDHPLADVTLF